MGEFLMHAAIFAFAIPTAIVVIIVIILASILLIAALLLGNRLRKSRRSISPDVWGAKGPAPQHSASPPFIERVLKSSLAAVVSSSSSRVR